VLRKKKNGERRGKEEGEKFLELGATANQ